MTELLYDSDNPDAIPSGVNAAGYISGYAAVAWLSRGFARFPNARRINVTSLIDGGDTFDVERGDLLPWEAPEKVEQARARGVAEPWVYMSYDLWAATRTEFHLRGIPEPKWWVALYDGIPAIPAGAVAKQYADPARIPGNPHYDLSVCEDGLFDGLFGGGGSRLEQEDLMKVVVGDPATLPAGYVDPSGPGAAYITNGLVKRHILSTAEQSALLALIGQAAPEKIDQATLDRIPRIDSVPQDNPTAAPLDLSKLAGLTTGAAPEPKTLTIPGPITGTLS